MIENSSVWRKRFENFTVALQATSAWLCLGAVKCFLGVGRFTKVLVVIEFYKFNWFIKSIHP